MGCRAVTVMVEHVEAETSKARGCRRSPSSTRRPQLAVLAAPKTAKTAAFLSPSWIGCHRRRVRCRPHGAAASVHRCEQIGQSAPLRVAAHVRAAGIEPAAHFATVGTA